MGSSSFIKGAFIFNYIGSWTAHGGNLPVAGSGSFVTDGNGKVTGGTLLMNCNGPAGIEETNVAITGGCYSLNNNSIGFMSWQTSDTICDLDSGIDLDIVLNPGGVWFASDAGDINFHNGLVIPVTGTAIELQQ